MPRKVSSAPVPAIRDTRATLLRRQLIAEHVRAQSRRAQQAQERLQRAETRERRRQEPIQDLPPASAEMPIPFTSGLYITPDATSRKREKRLRLSLPLEKRRGIPAKRIRAVLKKVNGQRPRLLSSFSEGQVKLRQPTVIQSRLTRLSKLLGSEGAWEPNFHEKKQGLVFRIHQFLRCKSGRNTLNRPDHRKLLEEAHQPRGTETELCTLNSRRLDPRLNRNGPWLRFRRPMRARVSPPKRGDRGVHRSRRSPNRCQPR